MDLYATGPSRIVNLSVETVSGNARESVRLLVNFRPDREVPFRVLEAAY
jgi:hypothetical protein